MSIAKCKKDELRAIAEELKLIIPDNAKILDLRKLIQESDIYNSDKESYQTIVDSVLEEIRESENKLKQEKLESENKLEIERLKLLQLEKELELIKLRDQLSESETRSLNNDNQTIPTEHSVESLIKSVKTLTIPVPQRAESFNLFFQSIEKAFKTKNVPEKLKPEILLNILGEKACNLMVYLREEDLSDYDKLKAIVLKEFQPTPNECLNHFRKAQKLPNESYVQFASRLSATFEYYCKLREVNDFKSLCELIVSDKIIESLDRELNTHISIKQGETFYKPHELGREIDIFLSSRGKIKSEPSLFSKQNSRYEQQRHDNNYRSNLRGSKITSNVYLSSVDIVKCICCKGKDSHPLYLCSGFKSLNVNERVEFLKTNSLCFKCLSSDCNFKKCKARNCFCGKPHNRLIHFPKLSHNSLAQTPAADSSLTLNPQAKVFVSQGGSENAASPQFEKEKNVPFVATSFSQNKTNIVFLSTVRCLIRDKYGAAHNVRCLLDVGSQSSFITKECAERLQLKREKINLFVSCLNDSSMTVNGCVTATINNVDMSFKRDLDLLVVKKITDLIPSRIIDVSIDLHKEIKLADDRFNIPDRIDILLGAEIFYELLRPGQIYTGDSQILLQNTVFGYVVSGTARQKRDDKIHCGLIRDSDLNSTLKSFWELESIGVKEKGIISEEDISLETFKKKLSFKNGRYEVELPWKRDSDELSDNFCLAKRRLESLMRRMQNDKVLHSEYSEVLKGYLDEGIIEKVISPFVPTNNPVFYLPHQVIIKKESLTTKLRIVFDASAHEAGQLSLNDCLFQGVNLNPNIFDLLISFRLNKIAVLSDVEKAFLQISLAPKDKDVVRFLVAGDKEDVEVYRFNRVLFGVNASPFLLAATIKAHIEKYAEQYPDTVRILDNSFYVDDFVTGEDTVESAFHLSKTAAKIMNEAGMNLRKWITNDCDLMKQWHLEHFDHLNINDLDNQLHRVLGLLWNPQSDNLSLNLKGLLDFIQERKNTKRFLLMAAGRIFDPLGFVSPFTIRFKILFQEIWQRKIDWDQELLPDISEKFEQWCSEVSSLSKLQIPRYIMESDYENFSECEIHTFSDSSIKAYGAVSYIRLKTPHRIAVHLVASKSRVAPLKQLTLPRLELMGALLAARLANEVSRVLGEKIPTTSYFWTDSTIVLSWIQGPSSRWKVFVSNRVREIQSLTDKDSWHHCPGKDNPSDLLTRGVNADLLLNCEKWWNGPSFLHEENIAFESESVVMGDYKSTHEELNPAERKAMTMTLDNNFLNKILSVYNNFYEILCVFSYLYRFIENCRNPLNRQIGPLTISEIQRAETRLVKLVQQEEFRSEVKDLASKGIVSPQSKIKNLYPFLDSEGILRVGGRLTHSNLSFNRKHQIILPNNHRLTTLILEMTHKRQLHVGPQNLLSIVRQKYWPLNGRNLCRKLVHNCIICFKAKPVTCSQIMGQLPTERISQSFPFYNVGLDFCGHFWIKYPNQRKGVLNKVYVCVFVCMVTKACHLEIVCDLTTDAFIATLKRFFGRRGKPRSIFCDNASNFVGTHLELERLRKIMSNYDNKLNKFLCEECVKWNFIPPRAPHHGGLWEAAVKAVKYHLRRVMSNLRFTYEQFLTILNQIEGILNSRPLYPLSCDPEDFDVLTPGHFLIGRPITAISEPNLIEVPDNRLRVWQKSTKIVQQIWRHWSNNYLSTLQNRTKWYFEKNNVKVNDMVILKEENLAVCNWLLGRILDVYYGKDNKIRVVLVKTKNGVFKRPVTKLCVLPFSSDE